MSASMASPTAAGLACPACGGPLAERPAIRGSDRLHGTPGTFAVAVCPACGAGVTLPVVGPEELGAYYPDSYNAYGLPDSPLAHAAATLLFRTRYARGLRTPPLSALRERSPGRLLDVGGGRGDLAVMLAPRGWRVTSLDPSEEACAAARERGVDAVAGTLGDPPVAGPFEAVVFQHSLEHVPDVAGNLRAARALLADGGLLLIGVPNFGGWQRRRFGADWFHLDLPRHRTHFTPRALAAALSAAGFEDVELSTSSSLDGLPMSLQYRRYGRRVATEGAARYAAAGASLLAAPLTAGLNALGGDGDILHAVARK